MLEIVLHILIIDLCILVLFDLLYISKFCLFRIKFGLRIPLISSKWWMEWFNWSMRWLNKYIYIMFDLSQQRNITKQFKWKHITITICFAYKYKFYKTFIFCKRPKYFKCNHTIFIFGKEKESFNFLV